MKNEVNENLDICRECGGKCCIKSGCDYGASDFQERTYNHLLKSLSEGDKSIVAAIKFNITKKGKIVIEPLLYIRARNVNRDIIDLISMKTRCSQLGENGCKHDYNHRPLGGRNLTPSRPDDGPCQPVISPLYIANSWKTYQNQLRKIVKHYTGMSVEKKIHQDVENLFYDVLMENFENVSPLELRDIKEFVEILAKAYPNELQNAYKKTISSQNKLKLNRKQF